jgi:hypothetical protein
VWKRRNFPADHLWMEVVVWCALDVAEVDEFDDAAVLKCFLNDSAVET